MPRLSAWRVTLHILDLIASSFISTSNWGGDDDVVWCGEEVVWRGLEGWSDGVER